MDQQTTMDSELFQFDDRYSTTRSVTTTRPVLVNKAEDKVKSVLFLPENSERKADGGLRTQGYFKRNDCERPLISVITVVFNGAKHLERTILSVIGQDYDNVEYIIVDGGSTDGTLDIIKQYEGQIDYWVSEQDKGIYDAMNKGVSAASGEWINFMNAGDWYCSSNIIRSIFSENIIADFVYGDVELRYPTFSVHSKAKPLSRIWQGMAFSHQSLFVTKKWHKMHPFDTTSYKVSSDYNFICSMVYEKYNRPRYVAKPIASIDMVGYSGDNVLLWVIENYRIAKIHNKSLLVHLFYSNKYLSSSIKEFVKARLPIEWVDRVRKVQNK